MAYKDSNRCTRTPATAYEESASQPSPRRTSPVHPTFLGPSKWGNLMAASDITAVIVEFEECPHSQPFTCYIVTMLVILGAASSSVFSSTALFTRLKSPSSFATSQKSLSSHRLASGLSSVGPSGVGHSLNDKLPRAMSSSLVCVSLP